MEWMKRLLRGEEPVPPASPRAGPSWDELVAQTRSPDGRQRQAAVRALAASGHAPALPAMLERANDWVDAIRRDAREALDNFLRPEFAEAWIASLEAVDALARGRRADHTLLVERIVAWLLQPAQFARLRYTDRPLPRELARVALRVRLREPLASGPRELAWRLALLSADVVQALMAANQLRDVAATLHGDDRLWHDVLAGLVAAGLQSRFGGVRSIVLRVALARPSIAAPATIHAMCFDRHAGTRALAIATLRVDESALRQVSERALASLGSGHPTRTRTLALDGLCAIDLPAGLARCAELRHDASPVLRALALRHLLAHADGEPRDALVREALVDAAPRVRRAAVAAVARGASAPDPATLMAMTAAQPQALSSLCHVAERLSPWDRLHYLLATLVQAHADADILIDALRRWTGDMRHTYVTPTAAQRERLRHAWAAARDQVPRALQDESAFHLRAFRVLDA